MATHLPAATRSSPVTSLLSNNRIGFLMIADAKVGAFKARATLSCAAINPMPSLDQALPKGLFDHN